VIRPRERRQDLPGVVCIIRFPQKLRPDSDNGIGGEHDIVRELIGDFFSLKKRQMPRQSFGSQRCRSCDRILVDIRRMNDELISRFAQK
jgi:hypothetical protein